MREGAMGKAAGRIEVQILLERAGARRMPAELDLRGALLLALGWLEAAMDLLGLVHGALPETTEAMLAYEVPYDVEAEIRGVVECVLVQDLGPVAERLRAAATVTPEELRRHWEEHRR